MTTVKQLMKKRSKPSIKTKDQDIRQLVIARLRSSTSGRKISIGSAGDFTTAELIDRIEKKDEVGKKVIDIQMAYLRSFKTKLTK